MVLVNSKISLKILKFQNIFSSFFLFQGKKDWLMIFIFKQPKSFTSFCLEISPKNFSFHFAKGLLRKGTIRFGDNMHCSHNMSNMLHY